MHKRAAIYVRVSTDKQTVENQLRELRQIAERRGWEVVKEYSDAGISGSKGRDGRPWLDQAPLLRRCNGMGDRSARPLAHRLAWYDPNARSLWRRSVSRPAINRHHDAG